jgi:superfamily II DNA or RNA helicase
MADSTQTLFEAVRQACYPATWSRGVELSRADAVAAEGLDDDEATFLVTLRGGMISYKVSLFLDDVDWDCECRSRETACEHAAASVIAWHHARRDGKERVQQRYPAARVGYRFARAHGGLALERVLVQKETTVPLEATLAAVADGRVAGGRFIATQDDLNVELALGTHRRGLVPPRLLSRLFVGLSRCADVTLDGRRVEVSREPLLPRARLTDSGDGFFLVIEDDPGANEKFPNGAVLCGETLRVIGDPQLTGVERHRYVAGHHFGPEGVAELVTDVLPSLRRRIPVQIDTDRLPQTSDERPRVVVESRRRGDELSALATLVYGDPPVARIDAGRLVHLNGPVPLRDVRAEQVCVRELERALGLTPGVRAEFEGEEAVAFAARLSRWDGPVRGGGLSHFRLAAPLTARIDTAGGFDVVFESAAGAAGGPGGGRADSGSVLRAWREGGSLVPLTGGGWAAFPRDWLDRFGHRVIDLLTARDADGRLPRCCMPDLARLCEDLDQPAPPEVGMLRRLADGFDAIPAAELPDDLTAVLREYQRHGIDWLVFLREAGLGALLADDMGLGKTLQALCAIRPPALVVAPTSVLYNWAAEIRRHRPGLSYCVYHGPRRALDPAVDVTLTTYTILRMDAERLAGKEWKTLVLDEAQNIKNPGSQVAAAAYRIDAAFRMALTGTPVENRLDELWSQFHFVNRGLLGGRRHFRDNYSGPIAAGDETAARRLRERIRPFILRRLKSEVARELPPRTDMVLRCELSEAEREVYDTIRAATLGEVVRKLDSGGNVLAVLEALLRLRQAACHPGLIPGRSAPHSSKLRVLFDALDSVIAEGHKALVFSQWTSLLDLAEPHLREARIRHVRLDGSTRDREGVVRRFQEEEETVLMLVSLKAGGTGLNLTAADHIFLLDPWWNPAVEDQAADRAHRIGQERPVMVYRLVASDTVEERILELQKRKREIAEVAVGEAGRAAALTREDLLNLLS